MNPVDAALAKKRKVTLLVDTTECKYCGKVYHTGRKLTEHINQEHPGEQTIFARPFCTQPFNKYSENSQHLGEHKDRVIRCRLCNKEFKTITRHRVHTKTHVNQCPFCSENFLIQQALQDHVKENHETDPGAVERQCSLCEFTSDSISKLVEHNQSVHHPYSCNICFLRFSAEYKLEDHRLAEHEISSLGTSVDAGDQGNWPPAAPEPGDIRIPPQEPSREKGNQGDQPPKPPTPPKEPSSKEPKVPAELHQHHEVYHGRVKLAEMQGGKFPCPRCSREFLSESMLVNHSRDHIENVYGCNESPWHFNTVAGLIKHFQDTQDDRHFACTTCREVFASNPDLCKHTQSHHVKICHLCCRIFVSDDKLFDHMKETHPGSTECSREELIKGKRA